MLQTTSFGQVTDPPYIQSLSLQTIENISQSKLAEIQKKVKEEASDLQAFKWKYLKNVNCYISCLNLVRIKPIPENYEQKLDRVDFPVLSLSIKQLSDLAHRILTMNPKRKVLCAGFDSHLLIKSIANNYGIIPYHNFSHAFSLLLMFWQCSTRSDSLRNAFTDTQWLDMFIAAISHDLAHPGTNNILQAFLGKGQPTGYLQRYHITKLWDLIRQNKGLNFLAGRTQAGRNEGKQLVNRMIMSTDVSKHFAGVESLKKLGPRALQEQKLAVAQQLFHACDIGNPCLPFQDYMSWGALVSWEFNQVNKVAVQVGVNIPNMKYEGMRKFYQGQKGFTNALVLPLWRQLQIILPDLIEFTDNINYNLTLLDKAIENQPAQQA